MNDLPSEVLAALLCRLRPSDRLKCAVTCRRVAQAVADYRMLGDIQIVLRGSHQLHDAMGVLTNTKRQYTSLRILKGTLQENNSAFWLKVGEKLRDIQLVDCDMSAEFLHGALRHCPNLESLLLSSELRETSSLSSAERSKRARVSMSQPVTNPWTDVPDEGLLLALSNVRHLSLKILLTGELFNHVLRLMPNITSFSLRHSFSSPLSIAGVISGLQGMHQPFLKLDFNHTTIDDEDVLNIVTHFSGSLQELRLVNCLLLTRVAYAAIGNCTELRLLHVMPAGDFRDSHLEKLSLRAPDLEYLLLKGCLYISSRGVGHLNELKRLRTLSLSLRERISSEALCTLETITSLQYLDLGYLPCEFELCRRIAHLGRLRTLILTGHGLTSASFILLVNSLQNLEKLEVRYFNDCTDADAVKLRRLKRLRHLGLSNAIGLTDVAFEEGVGPLTLVTLVLDDVVLTDAALANVAVHHPNLETLEFSHCERITDAGLEVLLRREPYLRKLKLRSCLSLSNQTLQTIRKFCPLLRSLKVYNCQMSFDAIQRFRAERPFLLRENI